MMRWYPVGLHIEGRACVVIGGGPVAERKVTALLAARGRVTVIAPEVTPALAALAGTHEIAYRRRSWRAGDLQGAFLAVAVIDDAGLQRAIAVEAQAERVLLNVADAPSLCTFISPAVLCRDGLTVAVSTGGASPALARRVRDELAAVCGDEYGVFARILGCLRDRLPPGPARRHLLAALVDSEVPRWLRDGELAKVDRLLADVAGEEFTLRRLGVEPAAGARRPETSDGS